MHPTKTAELRLQHTHEHLCFKQYMDTTNNDQNHIYHITGECITSVSSSLFLHDLLQKNMEVLYKLDPVD